MPYKSARQRKYMHANLPAIAERWDREEKEREKSRKRQRKHKR